MQSLSHYILGGMLLLSIEFIPTTSSVYYFPEMGRRGRRPLLCPALELKPKPQSPNFLKI